MIWSFDTFYYNFLCSMTLSRFLIDQCVPRYFLFWIQVVGQVGKVNMKIVKDLQNIQSPWKNSPSFSGSLLLVELPWDPWSHQIQVASNLGLGLTKTFHWWNCYWRRASFLSLTPKKSSSSVTYNQSRWKDRLVSTVLAMSLKWSI